MKAMETTKIQAEITEGNGLRPFGQTNGKTTKEEEVQC